MSRWEEGEKLREEAVEFEFQQEELEILGGTAIIGAIQQESVFEPDSEQALENRSPLTERDKVNIRTGVFEASQREVWSDTEEIPEDSSRRRMAKHRLLKASEEVALAQAIERGDLDAKEKLISHNLLLVGSQIGKFLNEKTTRDDLMQMGTLGLIRAAEKYDWRKGFRFSTYATIWIKQALQRGCNDTIDIIRIPANQAVTVRKIKKAQDAFRQENDGAYPTVDQIAEKTELDPKYIDEVLAWAEVVTSLDKEISSEGDTTLGSLTHSDEPAPEELALETERVDRVRDALRWMPDGEVKILRAKYGFDGEEKSVSQIAEEMGVSANRVYQLLEQAEGKLAVTLKDLVQN